MTRHLDWNSYLARRAEAAESDGRGRLILLTTQAHATHIDTQFRPGDTLMVGRESAGVPADVHDRADARIRIPMRPGMRSLNVAVAAAIVIGEALRQTGGWPASPT
jgi:tRNA (cytidine/uridine-2'-O-)-methyltransferase